MCGRFTLQTPAETLQRLFEFSAPAPSWDPQRAERPRYNIAPTQPVLVARGAGGGREGLWASWGMTAAKNRLAINARSESVFVRPAFRTAVRRGRVIVFADGFLEWRRAGRARQPFHITRADGAPLVFAGVSAPGPRDADGERKLTCAILTTGANEDLRALHDRMPVLLGPEAIEAWLDPDLEAPGALENLFAPAAPGTLVLRPVSARVNKVEHDDAACLADPDPDPDPEPEPDAAPPPPAAPPPKARQLGFNF